MPRLVPRFLLERLADGAAQGSMPGAAVYVDIVGFTAMGDALATAGPVGAETVADTVQSVMVPIVEAVDAAGGFVASFPGDAVLALFPSDQGPGERRAVAAAERMQAAIRALGTRHTPYGSVTIAARVGVGAGTITWSVLSTPDRTRRTYVFGGSAPAGAIAAEQSAGPGDVVVHESLRKGLAAAAEPPDIEPSPAASAAPVALTGHATGFVDLDLVADLGAGEFRPVSTAFIALPATELTAVIADVFALQDHFGGHLDPVELGDKGCVIRLVWGAPVRHEGDDERCLRFVHELRRRQPGVRIGVTTGIAFTGFVGTQQRMGFITYGSHVNLAARLMASAQPGQVLVAGRLADQATTLFAVASQGSRRFKGFTHPVDVWTVEEPHPLVIAEEWHVGREQELAALVGFLRRCTGVAQILGPAGIGKSSLVAQARARVPEVRWIATAGDPVWREPLQPLRRLVADLLGQAEHASRLDNEARLLAGLDELGLTEHRIHLGSLVDLYWPDSTTQLRDPAARRRGVLEAVTALLAAVCATQRVVLQIDDLHWSDQETIVCLPELVTSLAGAPFALVLTTRDDAPAPGLETGLSLTLAELGETDLADLAQRVLGTSLAPATTSWLARRTGGNPFFAQQVLLHLRERDQLAATPAGLLLGTGGAAVPPSIGAVVVARLDGLPRELRSVVKCASVLGTRVELAELRAVVDHGLIATADLDPLIVRGAELGVWRRHDSSVEFAHTLVRDAAYETLLLVVRRRLHAAAAAAIEELQSADLGPHLHRLAHHLAAAGDSVRARSRERQAADRALGLGAYHEAGVYAAAGLDIDGGTLAEESADDDLGLWLALAASRMVTVGQGAPETKDAYDHAAALAGEASQTRAGFRALFGLRTFYLFRGDHERSLEMAERSLTLAERIGDPEVLEQAHLMVGNARFWIGDLDGAAHHLDPVLRSAVPVGRDLHRAGFVQYPRFTAVFPAALGRWLRGDRGSALRLAEDALGEAVDPFSTTTVLQTVGFIHCLDGRAEPARDTAERMLALAREHDFPVYAAIGSLQLGWARARLGAIDAGLRLMLQARQRMLADGTRVGGTLAGALVADANRSGGRYGAGLVAAQEALADAFERRELAFAGVLTRLRDDLRARSTNPTAHPTLLRKGSPR